MENTLTELGPFPKQFKFIKELGRGGGGHIMYVCDELIGIDFVVKKYSPEESNENLFNYDQFKQEAIMLFKVNHPNIVRIYNFYEYANNNLYIQMEYIEGKPIKQCIADTSLDWNKIFQDSIGAFCQLEENGILHRDIRSNNIMIDRNGNIKIIDFGFGKVVCNGNDGTNQNTACLNWEVPIPYELRAKNKYNHATDIYFLGRLFKDIVDEIDEFKYHHIVEKMIKDNEEDRYKSFYDIYNDTVSNINMVQLFCEEDIKVYQNFANEIDAILVEHCDSIQMQSKEDIEERLLSLLEDSVLENYIQHNDKIIECLIKNSFRYRQDIFVPVYIVQDFYDLFTKSSEYMKDVIVKHFLLRCEKKEVVFSDESVLF